MAAKKSYETALEDMDEGDHHAAKGDAEKAKAAYERARINFLAVLVNAPENVVTAIELGQCYEKLKQPATALATYTKGVQWAEAASLHEEKQACRRARRMPRGHG